MPGYVNLDRPALIDKNNSLSNISYHLIRFAHYHTSCYVLYIESIFVRPSIIPIRSMPQLVHLAKMNTLRALARPVGRSTSLSTLQNQNLTKLFSTQASQASYLLQDKDSGLGFIRSNPRTAKPRKHGVTEIRGPYYSAYGKRHFQDIMDTMGHHVDGLKFAGGSFSLTPEKSVTDLIEIAHQNDIYVSTASTTLLDIDPADEREGRFHGASPYTSRRL